MKPHYFEQVRLLLKVLPHTLEDPRFALKGGTAINLFYRDMARLSVDIDLCYLPIEPREKTLSNIKEGLETIAARIRENVPGCSIETKYTKTELAKQLLVHQKNTSIKVEINLVVRGTLYPCTIQELSSTAQTSFETRVKARCASFADVYAGKLCAALDRQHPRDWYDTWVLLEHEGITEEIRKAFLLYLISGNRPIAEMLDPLPINQEELYLSDLYGMNEFIPAYSVLEQVRSRLTAALQEHLTNDERLFLLSLKSGEPAWHLSGVSGLDHFPAVQWKLLNIKKMAPTKKIEAINKLKKVLRL